MKALLYLSTVSLLFAYSCRKDVGPNPEVIESGKVQFELNNDVSLQKSIAAIRSIDANEYDLNNFYYTKVIPGDSMSYYFNLFKSCNYIKVFDIFKKTGDNFTRFRSMSFKNMDNTLFYKWDSLVQKEKLKEIPNAGEDGLSVRNGFLYVEAGKEKVWIDKLKGLSEIKSAGYVYVNKGFD